MIHLDHVLEGFDLSNLHTVLTMIAFFLTVYVMQLTGHAAQEEGWGKQWSRRIILAVLALSLLWSLYYSETHRWQPWPSDLLTLASLIGVMGFRAQALFREAVALRKQNQREKLSPRQVLPRMRVTQ